ncbi:MAG: peptidoglycan-binding protein [Cyanobacteria bacterium J06634_5]
MIRRSTLVFLTCLAALGTPAMRTKDAASAAMSQQHASSQVINPPVILAQASQATLQASISPITIAQADPGSSSTSQMGMGSQGKAVTALQKRLASINYYNGPIDGVYGLATQRAVVAFQSDEGFSPTGSMTEETWQRIQELSEEEPEDTDNDASASSVTSTDSTSETTDQTVTAPTASELPPIGAGEGNTSSVTAVEDSKGGLGKVFGLSLGLVAVLSSFGVGFYMANRSKTDSDELDNDGWSTGTATPANVPMTPGSMPTAPATLEPLRQGGTAPANGSNGNGRAITHANVTAIHTNGQIGNTSPLAQVDVIEGLIGDLRNPEPTRRRKAIWELGQRGNSLAMQPLVDSMVNADSKEKSLVLAALSEIGIRSLKPMSRALAIALQDDNPEVRKNAIRDLTRVYELVVQISQMLGHATEDEDPEVRQTATWALDQLNRIRRSQDIDSTVRTFTGGAATPIDLLSSEASMRRNSQ